MALWQVMWPPKEQKTWKQRLTNEVDDSGKHGKSRFIMIKECFFHCISLWLKTNCLILNSGVYGISIKIKNWKLALSNGKQYKEK